MSETFRWQHLVDRANDHWPPDRYRDLGVVVGCSGGADSVALARVLAESYRDETSTGFLILAHFNHQLRGSDGDRDAGFVRDLAAELNAGFRVGYPTDALTTNEAALDPPSGVSDEASLRDQRRGFFLRVLKETGARYLALGHSQTDQAETVLFRLMRGTGALGLAGIAPFRTFSDSPEDADFVIARPLLGVSRENIRRALRSRAFAWCEDGSNESVAYRRNWIRKELLPVIQRQFPKAVEAIARAAENQRQWARVIEPLVDRWLEQFVVSWEPLRVRVDRSDTSTNAALVEALRRCWSSQSWPQQAFTQTHWLELAELVRGRGASSLNLPGLIRAVREGDTVLFCSARPETQQGSEQTS